MKNNKVLMTRKAKAAYFGRVELNYKRLVKGKTKEEAKNDVKGKRRQMKKKVSLYSMANKAFISSFAGFDSL